MDIEKLLTTVSSGYFAAQVITIVGLCIIGYVIIWTFCAKTDRIVKALLSFPAGLSWYCAVIYAMLVLGIKVSMQGYIIMTLASFLIFLLLSGLYRKKRYGSFMPDLKRFSPEVFLILVAAGAILACIATSGLLSVSLDNDSFYYYSSYPQLIIREGGLKYEFDVFLTDVGPVAAVINTLPFLFGFSNTFGIQHFLNFVFIIIFAYAVCSELTDRGVSKKTAVTVSFISSAFMASCPAYLTTAKWIMAGDWFMVFFFLLAYFGYRDAKNEGEDMAPVLMLFSFMVTGTRQEGPLMLCFLAVCFCMLPAKGKRIDVLYLLPAVLSAGMYYFRIFVVLGVQPLYAFLTRTKAVLILCMLLACSCIVLIIKTKPFEIFQKRLHLLIPAAVLLLNAAMLIVNHERYLTNFYMFFMNVRLRNGWGYFGYVFFVFIILAVVYAVISKDIEISFFDVLMIGYILAVVCVSWGRGDHLRIGTGDSGNRVMLTAVPIIIFSMTIRISNLIAARK
ncbi:MAG: hypothetical protein J5829_05865 [Lachnospiraceae bacterium]|nr:hypothetical protein [Lachnospiraceae bacterium]